MNNTNKNLIIQLLIQNMKHEQLISGLNKLGFESDLHGLDIFGVVAELMGISEKEMSWDWFETYMDFIGKAGQYEITCRAENLIPLAETCYVFLKSCAEKEQCKATKELKKSK